MREEEGIRGFGVSSGVGEVYKRPDYDAFSSESGRIFFASGDHGEGWRGFIDGAIGSGIRAAQRVNKLLGG